MLKYLFDVSLKLKLEFIVPRDTATAFTNSIPIPNEQIIGKTMFLAGGEKCRVTQGELLEKQFTVMGLPMLLESPYY